MEWLGRKVRSDKGTKKPKIDAGETTRLASDPSIVGLAEMVTGAKPEDNDVICPCCDHRFAAIPLNAVRRMDFYRAGWKRALADVEAEKVKTAAAMRATAAAQMESVAAFNEVEIAKYAMELAIVAREPGHAASTKRDELLMRLRYNFSAVELARISGLSRQRVHGVFKEDDHYKAVMKTFDEQAENTLGGL